MFHTLLEAAKLAEQQNQAEQAGHTAERTVFVGSQQDVIAEVSAVLADRLGADPKELATRMLHETRQLEKLHPELAKAALGTSLVVKVANGRVVIEEYKEGALANQHIIVHDNWREALLEYCLTSATAYLQRSESIPTHLTSDVKGGLITIGKLFTRSRRVNDMAYRLFPSYYRTITKKLEQQLPQLRQIRLDTYARAARR